jgi:hypothetical protein
MNDLINHKVFIGLSNNSGIGVNLMEGFRKNGIYADYYSGEKQLHKYDYESGYLPKKCPTAKNRFIRKLLISIFFVRILLKYKYFIFFQAGWTLMSSQRDVRILRFFGKKTMVVFVGCDARLPEKVARFIWNPCDNCPDEYKRYVNCNIARKKILIPEIEKTFDLVASPEECAGYLSGNYYKINFPRNIISFKPVYPELLIGRKIRILHAPSNNHYKGTKHVRDAINSLKSEYDNFEYIEKQGIPIEQLREVISSCDLIIDQLIVGYYGLFAVESMALGKPVIVYMRPDIWEKEKSFSPLYNANPDNILDILRSICKNPGQLNERGKSSRAYVEKFHDSGIIALDIYNRMKGL